jgi:hypothetical protein
MRDHAYLTELAAAEAMSLWSDVIVAMVVGIDSSRVPRKIASLVPTHLHEAVELPRNAAVISADCQPRCVAAAASG